MAHVSEPRLLALHGLRIKGFAEPGVVAELMAIDEAIARAELDALLEAGLVTYRDGRMSGFTLTPGGRSENERLLAEELDQAGVRGQVAEVYERFLELNSTLLELCTAWQMRDDGPEPVPNEHTDPDYDQAVIGRLVSFHDDVRPVCADLREALERFGRYNGALRGALEKLVGGDHDYFTKPLIPSYHTIWFELHEDLLATLGLDRGAEGSS